MLTVKGAVGVNDAVRPEYPTVPGIGPDGLESVKLLALTVLASRALLNVAVTTPLSAKG